MFLLVDEAMLVENLLAMSKDLKKFNCYLESKLGRSRTGARRPGSWRMVLGKDKRKACSAASARSAIQKSKLCSP